MVPVVSVTAIIVFMIWQCSALIMLVDSLCRMTVLILVLVTSSAYHRLTMVISENPSFFRRHEHHLPLLPSSPHWCDYSVGAAYRSNSTVLSRVAPSVVAAPVAAE